MTVENAKRTRRGEEGVVLLMVVLLVVMFSGLGLLALRHTQGEMRSSGAYLDGTQAAAAAESAIIMAATDMRKNWRYPNSANTCVNYYTRFHQALVGSTQTGIQTGFSDIFNSADNCEHLGTLPVDSLNGTSPTALTGGPLVHGYSSVQLTQDAPRIAPPPPGFSSDDQARTYDWYYFTVTGRAQYGYGPDTTVSAVRGAAVVRAHMKIGPLDSIDVN